MRSTQIIHRNMRDHRANGVSPSSPALRDAVRRFRNGLDGLAFAAESSEDTSWRLFADIVKDIFKGMNCAG